MDRMIGARMHRSKLENLKGLGRSGNPLLSEEHGTARAELHEPGDEQEERGKYQQQGERADDVEPTLHRRHPRAGWPDLMDRRLDRPDFLLGCAFWFGAAGMNVQPTRHPGERFRTQSHGKL